MSDQEYEPFEVTDYDIENEFNPRRPQRNSKNQQIYGIWAQDEDSEDERPGFGKGAKKSKNFTAPIGFVAGGVQQSGKEKEKKVEDEEEDDEDSRPQSDSSDDEPRASFGGGKQFDPYASISDEIAGLRKKTSFKPSPALAQRGVGTWEKHTKGIGAKLLLQMGFQPGKGLGKDLQGIQAPIEASLRKGRGAIGAYGPEKGQKVADVSQEKIKGKESKEERVSQWRKTDGSKNRKARYFYKTIEDVLDQSVQPRKREFNELTKVKVIDMTGPEQRVLSGYHAISGNQKPADEWEVRKDKKFANFQMPELQHNLNLLVDMCEQEIITKDRQLRYNEDRIVGLESELSNLDKVTENEANTILSLERVLGVLEDLILRSKNDAISLDEVAISFKKLQEDHPAEFMMYDLSALAPSIVEPLMKSRLSDWNPLKDPASPLELMSKWKEVLIGTQSMAHTLSTVNVQEPFHRLLWETWMPCVRTASVIWNVKNPLPMIEFLNVWTNLIPNWILENILQQIIMPRLQSTAEEWNPLTDTIPVHTWIHPWVPFLSRLLSIQIYPIIRQKLGFALVSWHPSDSSARLLLSPWSSVFTPTEMDNFLSTHIIPKLAHLLQEFVINPQQQVLEPWNWVMEWNELIRPAIMADVLQKSFFPKWLQVLTLWLNVSPNYDQVTKWYTGWKSLIPDNVREQPVVREQLRTALELMSRSVGGPPPPPPPPIISHPDSRFQGMVEAVRTSSQMVEGFRDLLQKRCEERGILFHPLPNRFRESKQVFRCGLLQIYLDRNVIFYCDPTNNWSPIGLQNLLDKATGM